jgi:hypothetical protein
MTLRGSLPDSAGPVTCQTDGGKAFSLMSPSNPASGMWVKPIPIGAALHLSSTLSSSAATWTAG